VARGAVRYAWRLGGTILTFGQFPRRTVFVNDALAQPPTRALLLLTSYFLLPTSYVLLPTAYFRLPSPHCLLPISDFLTWTQAHPISDYDDDGS